MATGREEQVQAHLGTAGSSLCETSINSSEVGKPQDLPTFYQALTYKASTPQLGHNGVQASAP